MSHFPLSAALHALLNDRGRPVEDVVSEFFADDYRQRTGGKWADRSQFASMMEQVRQMTDGAVTITVLNELEAPDGIEFAERHTLSLELHGAQQVRESYVFGRRAADGRFAVVEEVTLVD